MVKNRKKGSKLKKALITILIVIVALLIFVVVGARCYFRLPVSSYYKASEKAFVIPGLSDNLVPQGLDYVESEGVYLIGGYQKDGSFSRVYRVDKESGKSKGYVVLADSEGNGISPHAGGLAAHGGYLFVAGDEDSSIYIYNLNDVLSANSGDFVKMTDIFETYCLGDKINVAFLCFTEDRLIVGEFYRDPNYITDESHWITTPTGDDNRALAYAYPFSDEEGSVCGISTRPAEIYSMPGLVQGMAVEDGKIWISQSYGTAKSTISCYEISESEWVDSRFYIHSGVPEPDIFIPIYALDSSTLVASFEAPPMAEEILFVDGKLLTMCESASNKYFFGNLTGGRWCYATDVTKLT